MVYVLFVILACIFLAITARLLFDKYHLRHAGVPSPDQISTSDNAEPSEQPVPATYSVPANQPLSISFTTLKNKAFIQRVGISKNKQMAVPSNVHMAGWYTGSVKPGEPGLSIIDGHVSGRYEKGAFANLSKLKVGDVFSVIYGDKHTVTFKVNSVKTLTLADAASALYQRDATVGRQLNLITCGGRYDSSKKTYDSRVLVVASAL